MTKASTLLASALAKAEREAITKGKPKLKLGNDPVLEKTVKVAVKIRLRALGCYHFWPVQMGLGTVTLDCLGCYNGRFFAIECKAPGMKPTLQQQLTMESIEAAGGLVYVVDNVEDARRLFDDFQKTPTHP